MELGTIEREIYIDALPEVVYQVVSSPEHVREWWPDEARYDPTPGSTGEILFRDRGDGDRVESFTVVEALPPLTFSFRWTHPAGAPAAVDNSLLVTFALSAAGAGTLLRMTETGFRERGWAAATVERQYRDHVAGWDYFLPRIAPYVATLQVRP